MSPREVPLEQGREGGCGRPELASLLVEWDALESASQSELFAHAAACPTCGPKLQLLQRAEAWLDAPAPTSAAYVCPSAENLYDYGRGPGARALSEPERVSLKAHLSACADCSGLVETLASRPPVPLIDGGELDLPVEVAPRPRRVRARPGPSRLFWIPLAAAAGLALAYLWPNEASTRDRSVASAIRFPSEPVLRGSAGEALWFPRDRVLHGAEGPFAPLLFELAPRERATSYRVRLFRHDGSAFAAGESVANLTGDSAAIDAGEFGAQLEPGHFTWEAWAIVDGLDVELGRRDFEVVRDEQLVAEIDARSAAPEPARSESILHLLHDSGFAGDARAFARTLPPSSERDEYLGRTPGR